MKKFILGFIIGGLVFSGITVFAIHVYHANEIPYSPKNTNWNVNNVKTALDSLDTDFTNYRAGIINIIRNKGVTISDNADFVEMENALKNVGVGKIVRKKIGSWSNSSYVNINCTSIPNYKSLTSDNFTYEFTSITGMCDVKGSHVINPSKSYNATTGVLSISNLTGTESGNWTGVPWTSGNVYVYYVE